MKISRLLAAAFLLVSIPARADLTVTTVDFLAGSGVAVNAAGPVLVRMDGERNRLIAANTLTSSISIIDGATHRVTNISLGGRALQHLKAEAMTIRRTTGDVYLIGDMCFHIVYPGSGKSRTIPTEVQFESIAVDEVTGNAFIAGRESMHLGFYDAGRKRLRMRRWLETREDLVNLNATPPPPIRKVVTDAVLGRAIAVDGTDPALYIFETRTGKRRSSRKLALDAGGRWHLAGYDERTHHLYIVTETDRRKVTRAARIDIRGGSDDVVELPGYTEGVGIVYNPGRDELYIPYDNHASVHVVTFDGGGSVDEIAIPAYGNDAGAFDNGSGRLYIASWAFGEIDIIDLESRRFVRRVTNLGIIPHMFTMAISPDGDRIYFPKGATAVNGTFGSAVSTFSPATGTVGKIRTGWAPIDLIELPERGSFLVFGSEDRFAEVFPDGRVEIRELPFDYPVRAVRSPEGDVYLSYGPHQSYWPTVYIWNAKNGILTIDKDDLAFYDRRIPRQALAMALDRDGALYLTQNPWGREQQFLTVLEDQVRVFEPGRRIVLPDTVERETTQRILRYDRDLHRLYLVRIGERDDEAGILQVIDPEAREVLARIPLGLTPTDLCMTGTELFVTNFDSGSVTVIGKSDFAAREIDTGGHPLRLCRSGDRVYAIDHGGNRLLELTGGGRAYKIPYEGLPDNIFTWNGMPVITSHDAGVMHIVGFEPESESFTFLHRHLYPYGDTSFDTRNVSFYARGRFGDAVPEITRGKTGSKGRLWITDFLAGKLFIIARD